MDANEPGHTADAREVEAALRTALRRFGDSDPFTALGLERRADEAAVEARYRELVTRHHPHHFARHSPALTALATQAFVQMQHAHRRCRALLDSRKRGGAPANEARQLGAASDPTKLAISQTKRLLELSQFGAAAEVLERALADDPDNVKLNVWRFIVQARERRAADEPTAALAAYEEVLELAPGNREALDAVQVLGAQLDAPRGLLQRLLGGKK